MAYKVDKFNGTFLVNVEDGSIDTTTDLRFIGKNYAGYGEVQNENFLHLMENFANTSPPPRTQTGQIWYDSTSTIKKLKFWDGSQWKVAGGALPQGTPPANLTSGDLWLDTSTKQLYVFSVDSNPTSSTFGQSEFILVGPENTPELESTSTISDIVKDIDNVNHAILRVIVQDVTVMVFSNTEFTLASIYSWAQGKFSLIKKGATLAGPTSSDGVTQSDYAILGTASVAKGITGPNNIFLPYTELVRQSERDKFRDRRI
jgi:hypothetical protein